MFELITANRRRTVLLMSAFVLIILAIGYVFGEISDIGYPAVVGAFVFAMLMTWGSYYYSDKVALAISRAVPADPGQYARFHNLVEGLAIAAGIPKPRIYVIDDEAPNAFATGRNPENAAIAVTTGLLEKMNRVELEGVIGHEMSHIRNYDILVTTIAVTLAGVIVLLSDWMLRSFWFRGARRSGRNNPVLPVLLVAGLILALLAPLFAQLVKAAVSRRRESLADVSAVELTRYPPGLISALKKLKEDKTVVRTASRATAHLWIESPLERKESAGAWLNRMFDTHPPIDERIRVLESI